MEKEGHLENTVLEVFGDHGDHLNYAIEYTESAINEKSNPLLVVTVPETLRERIGDKVEKNTQKLFSHLDLFASDLGVLGYDVNSYNGFYHGTDFLTKEAPVRDCAKASIESRECKCLPTDTYEIVWDDPKTSESESETSSSSSN